MSRNTQRTVADYLNIPTHKKICEDPNTGRAVITDPMEAWGTDSPIVWDEWGEGHKEGSRIWLELNT